MYIKIKTKWYYPVNWTEIDVNFLSFSLCHSVYREGSVTTVLVLTQFTTSDFCLLMSNYSIYFLDRMFMLLLCKTGWVS